MARITAAKTPRKKVELTEAQKKKRAQNRRYHERNRKKNLRKMRERWAGLHPADKLLANFRRQAQPSMPRPGSVRSKDPRLIQLAHAYCEWSDIDEVVRTHMAAAIMSELTGENYVVDHAIPLNHPLVCGLHTHTNLQVVTHRFNAMKGNALWEGMSEITPELLEMLENEAK